MATKKKTAEKMTFAEILKAKKASTFDVPILLDPALGEARDKAKRELGAAEIRLGRQKDDAGREAHEKLRDAAQEKFDEADAEAEAATVVFQFKALGRKVL